MSFNRLLLLPAFLLVFFSWSCRKELQKTKVTIVRPVYGAKADVYKTIKSDAPRDVKQPGKMFIHGSFVYLTEIGRGIHIIDRTNPNALTNVSFVPIPGNQDVAVKGNYMYADCATDMLVLDISQPTNVTFVKYLADVFPDKYYQNGYYCDNEHVIVDWVEVDTMIALSPSLHQPGPLFANHQVASAYNSTAGQPGFAAPNGVGGSTARFAVTDNYVYAVTSSDLAVLDAQNPASPTLASVNSIGWDIETIFPYNNHLFIGSRNGMYIYSVANPVQPNQESYFSHANVCDPAIADGNYAYITLRNGTECTGFINELNVVDVHDVTAPQLVQVMPLTNPRGLSKDGDLLFICDAASGLRVINAATPTNVVLDQTINTPASANEVIAFNNTAYVIADNGLYLYDYSNYPTITPMGEITF